MTLSNNSLMGTPGIRRFVSLFILLPVLLSSLVSLSQAKRSACWRYGHSCWGGHGKRSGSSGINVEGERTNFPFVFPNSKESSSSLPPRAIESPRVFGMYDKTAGHFLPFPILSAMMMMSPSVGGVGAGGPGIGPSITNTNIRERSHAVPLPVELGRGRILMDWRKRNARETTGIHFPLGGHLNSRNHIQMKDKRNDLSQREGEGSTTGSGFLGKSNISAGRTRLMMNSLNKNDYFPSIFRSVIGTNDDESTSGLQQDKRDQEEIGGESKTEDSSVSASSPEERFPFDNSIFVRDRKKLDSESPSNSQSVLYTDSESLIPSIEESQVSSESRGDATNEHTSQEVYVNGANANLDFGLIA